VVGDQQPVRVQARIQLAGQGLLSGVHCADLGGHHRVRGDSLMVTTRALGNAERLAPAPEYPNSATFSAVLGPLMDTDSIAKKVHTHLNSGALGSEGGILANRG